ncbi:hypothetical protein KMY66_26315, partial [Klebsiella pneumoniae]|nr:hypothetical protein [Klebsiella pneumoniae]
DAVTHEQLAQAYRFLRRLEHGIQAINDEQTQRLPQDAMQRHQLAQVLGFADWAALLAKLNEYRQTEKIPFDELVSDRQQSDEQLQVDHQHNLSELEQKLSADNKDKLNQFWQSKLITGLSEEAKTRLNAAYPILINGLLHSDLSEDAI